MNSLQEFFSMGGYGAYVWSAYAFTFVVLAANTLIARKDYQARLQHVRRQQNRARSAKENTPVSPQATQERIEPS